ncbi:acyltransferase [Salinibacterium xinjiangense]|nr:acyltransferase [Salinibacterium xinjiangense]
MWPQKLTGGFIGVDVFFVISGFLITAHLMREYENHGRISLTQFWARRIRRLLPAALSVLASCVVAVFVLLPEVVRVESLRQIAAASVYIVNWTLAFDAVDYLGAGNNATLVQHYWTLSVEEQFYVAWPLLLVGVGWLVSRANRRSGGGRSVTFFGWTALAVVGVSFAYSLYLTWFSPSFSYFSTATRAWEFAAGALLAVVVALRPALVSRLRDSVVGSRSGVVTIVGVAVIVMSAVLLNGSLPFPGVLASLPVIGTLLVIAGGMPGWHPMSTLVSLRPVQFTGDVSYSLYLWHWPVITIFVTLQGRPPTTPEGLAIVALSVGLAAATKYFVEDPARRKSFFTRSRRPAYLLALSGAVVFVVLSVSVGGAITRQADAERAAFDEQVVDGTGCFGANALLGSGECPDAFLLDSTVNLTAASTDLNTTDWCLTWRDEDWKTCELGDPAATEGTIALVGDSHAAAMTAAFDEYYRDRGVRVITYTRFGCSGLNQGTAGADDSTEQGGYEYACRQWSERVRSEIAGRSDIDEVVYLNFTSGYIASGGRAPGYALTPSEIADTWNQMIASGKSVTVVKDLPKTSGEDVPACLSTRVGQNAPCSTSRALDAFDDPQVAAISLTDGPVRQIDLTDGFCDETTCFSVIGGVVVYADNNHIGGTYARTLMQYLGPQLR